jgi:hypothetical protein
LVRYRNSGASDIEAVLLAHVLHKADLVAWSEDIRWIKRFRNGSAGNREAIRSSKPSSSRCPAKNARHIRASGNAGAVHSRWCL